MKVKLRFLCTHKGTNAWQQNGKKTGTVKLSPQYVPEGQPGYAENKAFYEATPSGGIEFSTINEAALAAFEPGQWYEITVEKASE